MEQKKAVPKPPTGKFRILFIENIIRNVDAEARRKKKIILLVANRPHLFQYTFFIFQNITKNTCYSGLQ